MTLQALDIGCTRGSFELFAGVSFSLSSGAALRVAGRNGSGKSSLLRILCGLAVPSGGEVKWEGTRIQSIREQFCGNLAYIGHADGIKDELLAWENVAFAANMSGARIDMQAACDALDRVGLSHVADLPTLVLSQGQRKRVALARLCLETSPQLWILDEPFTALDTDATQELCKAMNRHLAGGGMLVYTTHQNVLLNPEQHAELDLEGLCPCKS